MTREPFGETATGAPVERLTLDNGRLRTAVLTYGATLQDVQLAGLDRHLTIGGQSVTDYEPGGAFHYCGAIVGPVANRIRDGRCTLDGAALELETNGPGGHALHGGSTGLDAKVWTVEELEPTRAVLITSSPDGEGGMPGNRHWQAEFALNGTALTLSLRAETDAPTYVSLANHSYWNLGRKETFHGHQLQVHAERYLPVDAVAMVTGDILPVADTPFDFRAPRALGPDDHIDNNFCLADARTPLRAAGVLTGPDGVSMQIETTEPGFQVYDARHMPAGGAAGHPGHMNGPRCGVAIEAQFWPDAPNQPAFPSIRLEPGVAWEQVTRFTFKSA